MSTFSSSISKLCSKNPEQRWSDSILSVWRGTYRRVLHNRQLYKNGVDSGLEFSVDHSLVIVILKQIPSNLTCVKHINQINFM